MALKEEAGASLRPAWSIIVRSTQRSPISKKKNQNKTKKIKRIFPRYPLDCFHDSKAIISPAILK